MATYTKVLLSSSTNGKGIKVAATASAGTNIHTAHATSYDEIWIYAYNSHTADVDLTIEFGGTTAPDDNIVITLPVKGGRLCVIDGQILTNSLVVKAFASSANKVIITGYVNRIT
jgi:hypothetical protein